MAHLMLNLFCQTNFHDTVKSNQLLFTNLQKEINNVCEKIIQIKTSQKFVSRKHCAHLPGETLQYNRGSELELSCT
jgi:hypothetical protein